jgi:ketosteroid isomerase-like protein
MSGSAGDTASSAHLEDAPARVVDTYLESFYRGDFAAARECVADDFSFHGPFAQAADANAFFASAEGLRRIVSGHRTVRQCHHGDDVSTLLEVFIETPVEAGTVLMSEWSVVRDGKIVAATVLFDTAAFRELVPGVAASQSRPSPTTA